MSTSPHEMTAVYQACLQEALKQCPFLIHRWCDTLAISLHERSLRELEVGERRLLTNAVNALRLNQPTIEQQFKTELIKSINADTRSSPIKNTGKTTRSLSSLSFDELELMGDNQVQQRVSNARLLQMMTMACDDGLAAFSARLSTAQSFKVVKPDQNPLRPEIVSQALINLLQDLSVDDRIRSRWLLLGAQPLGMELNSLYVLLNKLLVERGIEPAAYFVISSPDDLTRKSGEAIKTEDISFGLNQSTRLAQTSPASSTGKNLEAQVFSTRAESGQVTPDKLLTLDTLHQLMVGAYDDSFQAETDALSERVKLENASGQSIDFSLTSSAALKANEEKLSATHGTEKNRSASALPVALVREGLKAGSSSKGQLLAIEVVRLMIEQLTSDHRILEPVRKLLANAEPAFLRLGVTDPRFFSDKSHPARRLLEVMTAKSLAYASEDAPGFGGFMETLQKIADLLDDDHPRDAHHFASLLQGLENKLTDHTPEMSNAQTQAVQALLQAEQRNLLAEKIAFEIMSRPDFFHGNDIITTFITGPWAQVMAKERLRGEHGGIGSPKAVFGPALGDILWSINEQQASRHLKRLIRIIPYMLSSVREGLLTIDYPLAQSKGFFDELMRIHGAILKAEPEQPGKRDDFKQAFSAPDKTTNWTQGNKIWLAPNEARQSGFMDYGEEDKNREFQPTIPAPSNFQEPVQVPEPSHDDRIDLHLGAWVELLSGTTWLRAQLTWISPYNTLFMFTSQGGLRHSMTVLMLQTMMAQDRLKIISQQGLLDGALDGVARTAMRNSLDVT